MNDLVPSLEEALTNADEVWEALDHSAIAEAIPIVDRIVKIWRAGETIRGALFAARLLSFIRDSSLHTPEARARMRERAESEDGKQVGETLLLVLERLNDMQKPTWLAKVFAAYLAGEIKASDMRRLASAIDIAFGDDLIALITASEALDGRAPWMRNLVTSGLVELHIPSPLGGAQRLYHLSEWGQMFRKAVRDHS